MCRNHMAILQTSALVLMFSTYHITLVFHIYFDCVTVQATVRRYTTNIQHSRMDRERNASGFTRDLTAERLRNANAESEERAARKRSARMVAQQQRDAAMAEAAIQVVASVWHSTQFLISSNLYDMIIVL